MNYSVITMNYSQTTINYSVSAMNYSVKKKKMLIFSMNYLVTTTNHKHIKSTENQRIHAEFLDTHIQMEHNKVNKITVHLIP